MRNSVYILLLLLGCFFTGTGLYAQDNKIIETTMRSNDKIYVVMAVCITILVDLFIPC